jgi:hypothetical protein
MRVHYEILNQKGTPAFYSDTYTNRPTYGFAGRVFISTDTGQIFEDTGSAWSLIADAGVGGGTLGSVCANGNSTSAGIIITAGGLSSNSITNTSLTTGSIIFSDGGGLESQNNTKLYWDNTNFRLGIGNNSPGAPLDIHATGTNAHFNGTGTNNAYLQFQNAGTSKWRIGNTYSAGANSFDIYNNGLTNTPFSINSSTNAITLSANVTTTGIQSVQNGLNLGYASGGATASYTNIFGSTNGVNFALANGTGGANFIFQTLAGYNYTFPATTGTIALTSNLSSYLPLSGGSLTGNLATNSYISIQNGLGSNQIYLTKSSGDVYGTIQTEAGGNKFSLGNVSTIGTLGTPNITWTSGMQVGINNTSPSYELDVSGKLRSTTSAYFCTTSGNVGVGTSSPTDFGSSYTVLDVYNATVGGYILARSTTVTGQISADTTTMAVQTRTNHPITFNVNNAEKMRITTDGNVGVGLSGVYSNVRLMSRGVDATSSNYAFRAETSGAANIIYCRNDGLIVTGLLSGSPYNYTTGSAANMYVSGGGELQRSTSSLKYKTDVRNYDKGLTEVLQMRPVYYKGKNDGDKHFAGLIAEEIHELGLTEFVQYAEDGSPDALAYANMVSLLTKAIQELNEKLIRNNIN